MPRKANPGSRTRSCLTHQIEESDTHDEAAFLWMRTRERERERDFERVYRLLLSLFYLFSQTHHMMSDASSHHHTQTRSVPRVLAPDEQKLFQDASTHRCALEKEYAEQMELKAEYEGSVAVLLRDLAEKAEQQRTGEREREGRFPSLVRIQPTRRAA